eukprot:scaffold34921_cov162-Amphora_coffeaeformis.AAC.16
MKARSAITLKIKSKIIITVGVSGRSQNRAIINQKTRGISIKSRTICVGGLRHVDGESTAESCRSGITISVAEPI